MNYLKVCSLAATGALLMLALIGASTASAADVLCENNTSTPCNAKVAVNGVINLTAVNLKFTASPELVCGTSSMSLKVTNNNGLTNPTGEVTSLTFGSCKTGETACTYTAQNLPYHAEVVTPGPNLTVRPHSGGGNPGWLMTCAGFINCTLGNTDFTLPITSGNPAHVTASEIPLELRSGFLCPGATKLDATWIAQSPTSAIWVRSS